MAERKRILIADDDADLVDLLKLELTRKGFDVVTAADGQEALKLAREEKLDLVLLDVMMPGIDGYHVAQELSKTLGEACPKMIIITCRDVSREQGLALMCGASASIQKPIQLAILHARIEELLSK